MTTKTPLGAMYGFDSGQGRALGALAGGASLHLACAGVCLPLFRLPEIAMSTPAFSISVHDLDAGGKHLRLPVPAAWMRGVLEGTDAGPAAGDGELDVRVSKSGKDVVVHGTLAAELSVPCARCLEPARVPVREEISALAVEGGSPERSREDDEDDAPGEADVLGHDGDTLVLDDLVRDELLLGIPMIPLCSESCPGIRREPEPTGPNENVDPRMRPLLRLKKT